MRNIKILLVMLLASSGLISSRVNAGDLNVTAACEGSGLIGSYSENGVVVHFWSCPLTGGGMRSRIWDDDGDSMSEMKLDAYGTLRYWLAGIEVTATNTESERDLMSAVLTAAEAPVARAAFSALLDAGYDAISVPVQAIGGNIVAYETGPFAEGTGGCTDPETGCKGCCGFGCLDCYALGRKCTDACKEHDECVDENGHRECIQKGKEAILSFFSDCPTFCQGSLPPTCNCCGGIGPLCGGF